MVSPRQPRDARSSTAQTMLMQLISPGKRPNNLCAALGFAEGAFDDYLESTED
jgi:hypothetical protein